MGVRAKFAWTGGLALVVATGLGFLAPHGLHAAPAGVPADVTFTKDIAPILQRSCENCHRPDGAAPMSLTTLRRGAPVGARDQAAHRHRPARRRDAALVHGEEHRHPEVPQRSVAQRRRDREDRQVGRQRRAARQPGRHAAGEGYADDTRGRSARRTSIVKTQEHRRQGRRAGLVGRDSERADRLAEDRYVAALEIKEVNDVDTKHGSDRATVGGRFVLHHMIYRTQVLDANSRSAAGRAVDLDRRGSA